MPLPPLVAFWHDFVAILTQYGVDIVLLDFGFPSSGSIQIIAIHIEHLAVKEIRQGLGLSVQAGGLNRLLWPSCCLLGG